MSDENAGISICRRNFSQGSYSNIIFPLGSSTFFKETSQTLERYSSHISALTGEKNWLRLGLRAKTIAQLFVAKCYMLVVFWTFFLLKNF